MPCYQRLPEYLKDNKYQNPSDGINTPFQRAHNTDLHAFAWFPSHPTNFNYAMQWMAGQRADQPTWLDVFPFEQELFSRVSNPATPMFVDVGGGIGHQCAALISRFPQLKGRVILQDMPPVLQSALPTEGVKLEPHDFWTLQPVKGILSSPNRLLSCNCYPKICLPYLKELEHTTCVTYYMTTPIKNVLSS